jgi:hypothetical protein
MRWEIELHEAVERWLLNALDARDAARIASAIDQLEEGGPALGRPAVDTIKGSRHKNMKELRSRGGHLRVLFAFDPRRQAILLVGGDKSDDWEGWYRDAIPVADRRYGEHLAVLEKGRGR